MRHREGSPGARFARQRRSVEHGTAQRSARRAFGSHLPGYDMQIFDRSAGRHFDPHAGCSQRQAADHAARGGADLRIAARKTAVAGDFRPGGGFHHIDFAEIDHRRQVVAAEIPKALGVDPQAHHPFGRNFANQAILPFGRNLDPNRSAGRLIHLDTESHRCGDAGNRLPLETGHTVHLPVARSGNRPSIGTPLGIKAGHCRCGNHREKKNQFFHTIGF